jgi:hypothetical protein
MATLQIRKKSAKTWLHVPSDADAFILSKFYCKTDSDIFKIVEESGSSRKEYTYLNITVYDDTDAGISESFASSQALMIRLEALKYVGFNRDGDIPTSYIESVVAGTNVTIDNTDPLNPIISSSGGGGGGATLGLIKIVDKAGDFFTNLATASAYIRTFTSATITNESFSNGTFWFTVPSGSNFGDTFGFLMTSSAYIEDTLGLITSFTDGATNLQFYENTGNNILGNCTFKNEAFAYSTGNNILGNCTFGDECFNYATGINKIGNILLSSTSNYFAQFSTGRFEIYGTIGTTTAANYTNFFTTSTAVIWALKVNETNNAGGVEGDLATAQTNGAKLFFGYVPAGGGGTTDLSYTASPTNGVVTSSTGTDATIPLADGTNAGLLSPTEKSAISDIPTKTSDLINDGDNGVSHFISLEDLPSNIILYPTNASSDIGGYVKLVSSITDLSYNTTAVDVSTGAITTTSQLISSLATSANIIVGNPGVFNITTIGNIRRTSGSGTASFYFEIYKRTLAGAETLIATSANTIPVLDSGTYIEFSATALWNDGVFLNTDRVVMKFYANRIAGGSNPTYEFQFGGTTPVRSLVPIPINVVPTDPTIRRWLVKDSTPTSAVTGTTTITQIGSTITIPANTFTADDAFFLDSFGVSKTGTAGALTWRLLHNTSDTLTGASQITSASLTSNLITANMGRRFEINGGLLKCRIGGAISAYTDMSGSNLAGLSISFDPTITNYFFRTVILANSADSVISTQILISK